MMDCMAYMQMANLFLMQSHFHPCTMVDRMGLGARLAEGILQHYLLCMVVSVDTT